jgi:hypothetical protein
LSNITTEKGMARLAYQYLGSEKFKEFIRAFLKQTDDLYDSNVELIVDRTLETAYGVQLDGIGEIVGIKRYPGSDDDEYRWMIKAKIMINSTDMTVPNMIAILTFIFDPGVKIHYILEVNLNPNFILTGDIQPGERYIFGFLPEMLGVTTPYALVISEEGAFSFSEDPTGLGFGDVNNPDIGGNFAFLIGDRGKEVVIVDTGLEVIILEDTPEGIIVDSGRVVDTGVQVWEREYIESNTNEILIGSMWNEVEIALIPVTDSPWNRIEVYVGIDLTFDDYLYFYILGDNGAALEGRVNGSYLTGYTDPALVTTPGVPMTLKVVKGNTHTQMFVDGNMLYEFLNSATYPVTGGGYIAIKSFDSGAWQWEANINHIIVKGE